MKRVLIAFISFVGLTGLVTAQSDPLGPHNVGGHGCMLCHVPTSVQTSSDEPDAIDILWPRGSATPERITAPGTIDRNHTVFHTFVCLTCHDGSLASIGVLGRGFNRGKSVDPETDLDLARANGVHPVHVPYLPNDGCDAPSVNCNPDHWPSRVDQAGTLTWSGGRYADLFDNVYGRPARFYATPENGGRAMVECSTCHNPHSAGSARYKIQGQVKVKPSEAFLRGWYETQGPNKDTVSKFCRSCHYAQSGDAVNQLEAVP